MKSLFGLLCGLALVGVAHACDAVVRPRPVVVRSGYNRAVAHRSYDYGHVAVAEFIPIAVAVPVFSVGYQPAAPPVPQAVPGPAPVQAQPQAQAQAPGPSAREKVLEAQLLGLQRQLDALKRGQGKEPPAEEEGPLPSVQDPPPAPQGQPVSALSILRAKCAACHEAGKSARLGDGFTLLNGSELAKLDDRAIRKILSKTQTGKMPPRDNPQHVAPVTDEEVGILNQWADGVK